MNSVLRQVDLRLDARPSRGRCCRGRAASGSPCRPVRSARSTSGQRLDPPMPSTHDVARSRPCGSRGRRTRRARRASAVHRLDDAVSQPSALSMILVRVGSVFQSRSASWPRCATACSSSISPTAASDGVAHRPGTRWRSRRSRVSADLPRFCRRWPIERVERLARTPDALRQELSVTSLKSMPDGAELRHHRARPRPGPRSGWRGLAVVAEGVEGRRRHGADGLGADQLVDVEGVGVLRVLGADRRPERRAGPSRPWPSSGVPLGAAEDLLEDRVGVLGVGDRDLAEQRFELRLLRPGRSRS